MSLDGDERETQLSAKSMEEIRSNSTSIGKGGRMSCRVFYEINLRDYISARLSKPERWRNRVMHGRKDSRLTKFRNSNRVQKRTNERTSERTRLERVGLAVGASLSQSHQTTVIATGATSHRALDAQANTITPSFGTISFSLSALLSLFLRRLRVLLSHSPSFFNLKPGPRCLHRETSCSAASLNYSPPRMLPASN